MHSVLLIHLLDLSAHRATFVQGSARAINGVKQIADDIVHQEAYDKARLHWIPTNKWHDIAV